MSKKADKTMIGLFVVGALVLLIIGIVVFGSGALFKRTNKFVLYFDGSVKGLSIGAPVMFRGVSIGSVKDISLIYDAKAGTIMLPVIVEIEEGRIKGAPSFGELGGDKKMIELGLRGKLEVQSFLTGQLMISFDFYPDKPAELRGILKAYPELPTLPISPDIFELMNEIPIKEISKNLEATAKGINRLVNSSDLQRSLFELRNTFQETKQTMRSLRLLSEYLEQHPEAILKGKSVIKGE
ncbi:MAG: MlaD family protein [Candidatus Omnitrophica bacterium]|nr:MlaD family protein [Candidatus Omnitrophota bacterium]